MKTRGAAHPEPRGNSGRGIHPLHPRQGNDHPPGPRVLGMPGGPPPARPQSGLAPRLPRHSGSTRPPRAPRARQARHSSRLSSSGRAPPASSVALPSSPRHTGRAGLLPLAGLRSGAASISGPLPAGQVPSSYPSPPLPSASRPPVASVTPRAACAAGASSFPGASGGGHFQCSPLRPQLKVKAAGGNIFFRGLQNQTEGGKR